MSRACRSNTYRKRVLADAKALYGVALTDVGYAGLCATIRNGEGICLGRQSSRVTIWQVVVEGKPLVVLYNKRNGHVVKVVADSNTQKLAS